MAPAKALHQRAPRRRWPLSEKRRIVELTLREGVSIRAVAREQGVNPTSLCHWRTRYRAGKLGSRRQPPRACAGASSTTFLPVAIAPTIHAAQPPWESQAGASVVELTFSTGTKLRIELATLDLALVCALVAEVRR